ncbi:indolepyruvate ferredoxin oxidoreductase family protein [Cucumibacter marinus]|uniref:indolepyruvate ferredoxin oxidoreductase family protein n=1 Tax=Cucumibacter marinus TaxID=1121252 RepID=UPI000404EA2E|nr:indolepyruvate ferredoxin oxidoreductase family protein [Cucumibacter marinus]
MTTSQILLDDKYTKTEGQIFLSGLQALVRLPMVQMRRDRAAGLNTAALITGYRGSPLGSYDQQVMKAKRFLDPLDITFQPGVNEDLAATAIWGTQQVHLSEGATKDGVLGIWYGKGPGVDRSGDAFKHGNAAGTSRHGGVLALAGDDHSCKSSSIPHQSDHAFMSALMPMLYPSSIHEFLEIGLLGVAMSRYSGCWVGMKFISDTVETTAAIDLGGENREFVIPTDFEMPEGGLNLRWPDPPLVQDERLQEHKGYAAIAFARANGVDKITLDSPNARLGIVASGKAYEDVRQALKELGIGSVEAHSIGLRIYKVRMPWPLEPEGIRHFSEGLEEVLIIEERREIIENQIKQQLFNWRADVRPRIIGKFDHEDHHILSLSRSLTVGAVARMIANRVLELDFDDGLKRRIASRLDYLTERHEIGQKHQPPLARLPFYCAGCPHNTSTRVPEGSKAMAGIGCHFMAQWMDRNTETFTHMGAEGVPWTAIHRYTEEKHRFVNLGDGTYFHSGILAIRQSVSAKAPITYKILYNDAVAMTGGQHVDGQMSPQQVTHQLYWEGVRPIYLLTDHPEQYSLSDLAPGTILKHRDHMDAVMLDIREEPGTSAIVYVQTCAAEKRRRRKRKELEDPPTRVMINPSVCEGCGDCSVQSNCIAVEPLETEFGRKRKINQSACNKDYSCLKGFCPSFVTIEGGKPRKRAAAGGPDISGISEPMLPGIHTRPWNIAITGIGGTGILTIGAILGMAAHIEGKAAMILDMAGLAQKGGAVLSHVRIAETPDQVTSPRIVTGGADLLLAADDVVAAGMEGATLCDPARTNGVVNTKVTPVADFVRNRDFDFKAGAVVTAVKKNVKSDQHFRNFTDLAEIVAGDAIATNIMMLGYAWQAGLVPVSRDAIHKAIELNGVAVDANKNAFEWGRVAASAPERIEALAEPEADAPKLQSEMSLDELIDHRIHHLTAYQNQKLAKRYSALVAKVRSLVDTRHLDPALARAVAVNYAKVLAYKDEYEVARLFTRPEFEKQLTTEFDGDYQIAFHLAPPFLPGKDPNGRPKKRKYGPWMRRGFKILAGMKSLRGTPLDLFGLSADRKLERGLIREYEMLVERVMEDVDPPRQDAALELLNWPSTIRGFGPVKMKAAEDARKRLPALWEAFENPVPAGAPAQAAQ